MTGNFSMELSAAAGAAVGAAFESDVCAEARAAASAGSSKPKSLRENFIDSLLPACVRRTQILYIPRGPGSSGLVAVRENYQAASKFQTQGKLHDPRVAGQRRDRPGSAA